MPAIYGSGYKLLARCIGLALAEHPDSAGAKAIINSLIDALKLDNPAFDEGKFLHTINAVAHTDHRHDHDKNR